jgi:hypothetical protein
MFDLMEKAKQDGKVLTVEKYHTPEITWEDVAKFLYSESLIPNQILKDRMLRFNQACGLPHKAENQYLVILKV